MPLDNDGYECYDVPFHSYLDVRGKAGIMLQRKMKRLNFGECSTVRTRSRRNQQHQRPKKVLCAFISPPDLRSFPWLGPHALYLPHPRLDAIGSPIQGYRHNASAYYPQVALSWIRKRYCSSTIFKRDLGCHRDISGHGLGLMQSSQNWQIKGSTSLSREQMALVSAPCIFQLACVTLHTSFF